MVVREVEHHRGAAGRGGEDRGDRCQGRREAPRQAVCGLTRRTVRCGSAATRHLRLRPAPRGHTGGRPQRRWDPSLARRLRGVMATPRKYLSALAVSQARAQATGQGRRHACSDRHTRERSLPMPAIGPMKAFCFPPFQRAAAAVATFELRVRLLADQAPDGSKLQRAAIGSDLMPLIEQL